MTSKLPVNLAPDQLDDVRATVENALSVTLAPDSTRYGNKGDTIGMISDTGRWVRLQWRRPGAMSDAWTGPEAASAITGVSMPALYRSFRWPDDARGVVWRADEFELITDHAVSGQGSITTAPALSSTWWTTLRTSLTALSRYNTARVAMSGDHLAGRITEMFGEELAGVDLTVPEWATAHGDFHWGNLTAPACVVLDWESWGRAPRGYDAATLWGFSLGAQEVSARVESEFANELTSRSGVLSRVLFCANVLRQFAKRGVEMPFTTGVRAAVPRLLDTLH